MKTLKLKKKSVKALNLFVNERVMGFMGKEYNWDELIERGLVIRKEVPVYGSNMTTFEHTLTVKGMEVLLENFKKKLISPKYKFNLTGYPVFEKVS